MRWINLVLTVFLAAGIVTSHGGERSQGETTMILLRKPNTAGAMSVEEALLRRRSIREYTSASLALEQVAQLLWAAQGISNQEGFRTAPSAGATYPLETYLVAGNVVGLEAGVYRYDAVHHALLPHRHGDLKGALSGACLDQEWVRVAPASIVLAAIYERTTRRYGARGRQYVHMEVGHVAQNIYLQATAMGLGTVIVGAFEDSRLKQILDLPASEVPMAVLPVGTPRR